MRVLEFIRLPECAEKWPFRNGRSRPITGTPPSDRTTHSSVEFWSPNLPECTEFAISKSSRGYYSARPTDDVIKEHQPQEKALSEHCVFVFRCTNATVSR